LKKERKMQKKMIVLIIGIICMALIGCNSAEKIVRQKTINEKSNIFTEIKKGGVVEKGYAVLKIKASIKTHLEDYYLYESASTMHGKPAYPFVININGQAAKWNVDGQKEVLPLYDKKGEISHDPDAGGRYQIYTGKRNSTSPGIAQSVFYTTCGKLFYGSKHKSQAK
jgi:hypothetical protein